MMKKKNFLENYFYQKRNQKLLGKNETFGPKHNFWATQCVIT